MEIAEAQAVLDRHGRYDDATKSNGCKACVGANLCEELTVATKVFEAAQALPTRRIKTIRALRHREDALSV